VLHAVWKHRALPAGIGMLLVAACAAVGGLTAFVLSAGFRAASPRWRGRLAWGIPCAIVVAAAFLVLRATRGPAPPAGETVADWTRDPRSTKVALVAIDGLDGHLVDAAFAAGRMPNLRALVARGVRCDLRSIRPPKSPVVWTSAVTGVLPRQHGVLDFVVRRDGERIPVTSNLRKVPALWNLSVPLGFTVAFVNWYVTWPAEAVRGAIVSDRADFDGLEARVFPEALAGAIDSARATIERSPERDAGRLTDIPGDLSKFRAARWGQVHRSLGILDDVVRHDLVTLAAAEVALAQGQPDLTAVYFRGTDNTQHLFWKHRLAAASPRLARWLYGSVDSVEAAALAPVIDRYYDFADDLLGRIVARLEPQTAILVVSDHGFLTNNERGRWYGADRLLVAAGLAVADPVGPWRADRTQSLVADEEPPSTTARRVLRAGGAATDARAALQRAHDTLAGARTDRDETIFRSLALGEDAGGPWLAAVFRDRFEGSRTEGLEETVPLEEFTQPEGHSGDHRMNGFLAAAGPPFRRGRTAGARAVDLAPTVMHLLGGPAARDAEGIVRVDLLAREWREAHPVRYVESWGTREEPETGAIATQADERIREELRALGYLR
jgi:predicted AlkP superfamily phosphohydrolase/phosphomutase